ncbi:MAG: archaemetzincin [Planctomycetota bacterium]
MSGQRPRLVPGGLSPSGLGMLCAIAWCLTPALAASRLLSDAGKTSDALDSEIRETVYASISPADAKGFLLFNQWQGARREFPQSLEHYRATARVRPSRELRAIVLQPLGDFGREETRVLESLREYTAIFFQLPARLEKAIPLEVPGKELYRNVALGHRHGIYDKQYDGDRVLTELLAPRLPADALLYLGISTADLYCSELNYVFGVAGFDKRVGVYSLCRYYPEFWGLPPGAGDDVKGLRRACKILNHETGHMLGLHHCVFYRCSMNYSNSLQELDDTPIHYCPVCHRKLMWNLGFDPVKRYMALRDFYERHGMSAEAEWLAVRIPRWKTVAAQEDLKKVQDE